MKQENSSDIDHGPDAQTLMAAVIRLMAKCAETPAVAPVRTLLVLLGQLRGHPGLSRQPAVLAGLAEAHALWVGRLGQIASAESCQADSDCADSGIGTVH